MFLKPCRKQDQHVHSLAILDVVVICCNSNVARLCAKVGWERGASAGESAGLGSAFPVDGAFGMA